MRYDRLPLGLHVSRSFRRVCPPARTDHSNVVEQQAIDLDRWNRAACKADDEKAAIFLERSQRVRKAVTADGIEDDVNTSKLLDGGAEAVGQNIFVRTGGNRGRTLFGGRRDGNDAIGS